MLNVLDFGVIGDGVVDDTSAIQAVLNLGEPTYFPSRTYKLTGPLYTGADGQRIMGENPMITILQASSAHDILRIKHFKVEVSGLVFKAGGATNYPMRIYSGRAYIHDNRFLSYANGVGTAIWLTDVDPVTSGVITGAYTHRIERNEIGYFDPYCFDRGIDVNTNNNGTQACNFHGNAFECTNPIRIVYGGGNSYHGNLFQSSSYPSPGGIGIDLGVNTTDEHVSNNYFERFSQPIVTRRNSNTYRLVTALNNNFDNCTVSTVTCLGTGTNVLDDRAGFGTGLSNITGLITAGTNVTLSGAGTSASPYAISASVSGGGGGTFSELTGGTAIGDMTQIGNGPGSTGLTAAFDGTLSKTFLNSSCKATTGAPNLGVLGKDWGSGVTKTVTRYTVWGSSDYGYDSTASAMTITIKLQGSNDNSTWTDLHTQTFADANNANSKDTTSGITTTTAYRYHRVAVFNNNGGANYPTLAQLKFYETI